MNELQQAESDYFECFCKQTAKAKSLKHLSNTNN